MAGMGNKGGPGCLDADGPRCFTRPSPKAFTAEGAGTSVLSTSGVNSTSRENRVSHAPESAAARSLARPLLRSDREGGQACARTGSGLAWRWYLQQSPSGLLAAAEEAETSRSRSSEHQTPAQVQERATAATRALPMRGPTVDLLMLDLQMEERPSRTSSSRPPPTGTSTAR